MCSRESLRSFVNPFNGLKKGFHESIFLALSITPIALKSK